MSEKRKKESHVPLDSQNRVLVARRLIYAASLGATSVASPHFSCGRNSTTLIPITMNLSDVKTQSPPESGLTSAARLGDHKSRGIYSRISYTYCHTVCNTDVKN